MNDGTGISSKFHIGLTALVLAGLLISEAQAQQPSPGYPAPNPAYPPAGQTYPGQPYPGQPYPGQPYPGQAYAGQPYPGQPPTPAPPKSHFFRDLFAQTIAAVLQTASGGLVSGIGGTIMSWFARKTAVAYNPAASPYGTQYPGAAYPSSGALGYPSTAYPSATPGYPSTAYPSTANNGYPTTAYPSTTTPGYPTTAYPSTANTGYPTTAYPSTANTGYPTTAYPSTATPSYPTTAYPSTATPSYPTTAYPSTANNGYPTTAYPSATTPGYPSTAYPSATTPVNAYPGMAQTYPTPGATAQTPYAANPYGAPAYGAPAYGASTYGAAAAQVYDARTGQLVTGAANPYMTRGVGTEGAVYAGIAYEVHAIGADGNATPVNTATHEFHTGDKFMLYYRPSLPGHMEIYNVNATGQQTLIDSSNMAAGQMVGLGPYQFANQSGDETLRLVLTPCSSPQLLAATRDIVKLDSPAQPSQPAQPTAQPAQSSAVSPGLQLASCGAPTARGVDVKTRDIQKVAVEDNTSFALDPLSRQELSSGQVTPRQAIVVFHHR